MSPAPYPVSVTVHAEAAGRSRLTAAVRPILVIPHALLVGPLAVSSPTGGAGFLGASAFVMAVISWFTLLISGEHPRGIREFSLYYLRWRARVMAYLALFVDRYPPFGDEDYPVALEVRDPAQPRDRTSIALRLVLVLPQLIVLFVLLTVWVLVTIVAWFAILFTGSYPASLLPFGLGVLGWMLRVEAYLLLLVDEYPPFTLE